MNYPAKIERGPGSDGRDRYGIWDISDTLAQATIFPISLRQNCRYKRNRCPG